MLSYLFAFRVVDFFDILPNYGLAGTPLVRLGRQSGERERISENN